MQTVEKTAREVVEKQIEYYNANDIEAFAGIYTSDVEVYDLPADTLRFKGNDELKARYFKAFEMKPHARIVTRMVEGNKVVDHEFYIREGMEAEGSVIAIYEVDIEQEKISKVWFLK